MKTCFAGKGIKVLILYLYQYGNAAIVSSFQAGKLSLAVTILCQLLYLTSVILLVRKSPSQVSHKKRLAWFFLCLSLMVVLSILIGLMSPVHSGNQETLIDVQNQVPFLIFGLFLVNASLVEEVVYRGYLWDLFPEPYQALLGTSLIFALAHHPTSLSAWAVYPGLGLCLGIMRQQTDLYGAMVLHVLWNLLVFLLTA
ncbi:membrane protease YdiL (CAAX protease family) [Streptococcus rupicaprae]|uniref:Membrane protease YdiL (CAAX protease family) n=1 Tax=Streptococcus rupicaprae TaxID=759619 RepID=A0ABV2FL25_9STRE